MDTASFLPWLLVAVLMFWSVGAYNRLVRLRNAIQRGFAPVDQHFEARHALLQQQIELLSASMPGRDVQALHAACAQADTARLAAKRQPGSADTINSLRLALQILAQARSRLPFEHPAALARQLTACEHALQFAQVQFNHAVTEYNAALAQFPAAWLGALFGFRSAGPL